MSSWKFRLRSLEQDLVGPDNRRLFLAWAVGVLLILSLGFILSSDSVSILGVAESREYQVNFDSPVTIQQVHVMPGQTVKKGDLLLELNQSDLETQLNTLKSRYDRLSAEIKLRDQISSLASDVEAMPAGADPLKTEWIDTQREIRIVEARLKNLFVFAEVQGRVGAVNFKAGEKVPSFAAIVTLLPLNPTYVNGFINENLHTSLEVGQRVEVAGVNGKVIQGQVISLGARIVPIPERLLRIQSLAAWGREVVVQIPAANEFLLGEKVSVRKAWNGSWMPMAQADETKRRDGKTTSEPVKLEFPESITERFQPEISGLVYIPELKQFVMVSDDYPKDKPDLLLMTIPGKVQKQMLAIDSLDKMEDIESVSYRNNKLYLLSSLSPTKKGKIKKNRQILARAQRSDMNFKLDAQVDLREFLEKARGISLGNDLEIEGHAIKGSDLYLALKNQNTTTKEIVILKVKNFERLFEGKDLSSEDVSAALKLQLSLPDKSIEIAVTDMIFVGDDIYLASSFRGKEGSAIWKWDAQSGAVSLIQEFDRKHLEALAFLPCSQQIYGVFEGGVNNYLTTLTLSGMKKESECF
ncbi:HlyD family secretion protein [Bdellovibrio sp. HCB337]|uniref:HlyD family secretion protein n=1 Tax=Bdellovibrio sp. HCB337 TaxID=3394358 RepID=UPI0039A4EC06